MTVQLMRMCMYIMFCVLSLSLSDCSWFGLAVRSTVFWVHAHAYIPTSLPLSYSHCHYTLSLSYSHSLWLSLWLSLTHSCFTFCFLSCHVILCVHIVCAYCVRVVCVFTCNIVDFVCLNQTFFYCAGWTCGVWSSSWSNQTFFLHRLFSGLCVIGCLDLLQIWCACACILCVNFTHRN